MNTFFELLGQFIKIFVDIIPRFASRASSTDVLVVDSFLFGPQVARSRPVIYVPILDIVEYWPVVEETVNTEQQSLVTADGVAVTVDTGFSYRITDPLKVRRNLHESYPLRTALIVRSEVKALICGHTFSHVLRSGPMSRLYEGLLLDVNEALEEYGIELTYFCVEDVAQTTSFRHYGINLHNANIGTES